MDSKYGWLAFYQFLATRFLYLKREYSLQFPSRLFYIFILFIFQICLPEKISQKHITGHEGDWAITKPTTKSLQLLLKPNPSDTKGLCSITLYLYSSSCSATDCLQDQRATSQDAYEQRQEFVHWFM